MKMRLADECRGRVTRKHADCGRGRDHRESERGVALVVVLTVIAILTVFVSELVHNTSTAFHVTVSERDKLRAEYQAKSGLNLMRLLIAREPDIRKVVAPMYQMMARRPPPQLNVWDFSDLLLGPFADFENAKSMAEVSGVDFSLMEGVGDTDGTFEAIAVPENAKINLNQPLFFSGDQARRSLAMQLYALMGGYQSPDSPYDPMFASRDPDGHFTTRQDIVSAVIDWWDFDEQRTVFDPGNASIAIAGSEDDIYNQYPDPYQVKNAPFDSLEELRLIRGVGEDFWATFVDPDPDDPRARKVTIYGSGAVNVNLAPPEVLLARLCSFATEQELCRNPVQAAAFIQLFRTARAMIPVALFSTPKDFIDFVSGRANRGADIYPKLIAFLGTDNPLMAWTPIRITPQVEKEMMKMFLTAASIFTIQVTGRSGRAQSRITAVVNFDKPWTPPPGVAGKLPPLGVFHHFRME
ncbi:MAG: type II secretion system protein GspK [Myxococcales bacterium]|jgi:general secretion pathway protein K